MDNLELRPEGLPPLQGLYDVARDHDACGIGLYANINNLPSHAIIESGLTILRNLEHRGAVGADPKAGDGAGIMTQLPHEFFLAEAERLKFRLPAPGQYGVGYLFMPREAVLRQEIERIWRETRVVRILDGTSEMMRRIVARDLYRAADRRNAQL